MKCGRRAGGHAVRGPRGATWMEGVVGSSSVFVIHADGAHGCDNHVICDWEVVIDHVRDGVCSVWVELAVEARRRAARLDPGVHSHHVLA